MLDQLSNDLDQAEDWVKYRERLKEFHKDYGPPYRKLQSYARDNLGVEDAPAQTTFAKLMEATTKEPSWKQVSLLVRICVRYSDENNEEQAGLAEHLDEILAVWKGAFVRLGGKLPVPPPAKTPVSAVSADGAEPPAVAVSGAPPVPSRRSVVRDWMRRRPKKLLIVSAVALVLAVSAGGYMLVDTADDGGKDRAVEAADGTPAPSPDRTGTSSPTATEPDGKRSPSSTPTSSAEASIGSNGSEDTGGDGGGADGASSGTSTGTTGGTSGTGSASTGTSGGSGSSSSTSGSASGATGTASSGSGGTTENQPYVAATIEWSNDVDGNPDPKDPQAIVKVYDTYRKGVAATSAHAYYRTASIRVKCQVTGGRVIELGGQYNGPRGRDGIWYLMDTGEWAPAVYVDTGKPSLPSCAS
jgi:hypothetical protein